MKNIKVIERIKRISLPILKRNGVVKAGIFGSYAKGENKKNSDIDMLIKFKGKKSLLDLVSLERKLKTALKKDVDLITYKSINPLLKDYILNDEVRIYG